MLLFKTKTQWEPSDMNTGSRSDYLVVPFVIRGKSEKTSALYLYVWFTSPPTSISAEPCLHQGLDLISSSQNLHLHFPHVLGSMWDLSSLTGIEPLPWSALGALSPNHWTAREVLTYLYFGYTEAKVCLTAIPFCLLPCLYCPLAHSFLWA